MALRKGLLKKGASLPGDSKMKFDSSHLKKKAATKREDELLEKTNTVSVKTVRIPQQYAVFRQRPRISPKTPRLR